MAEAIVKNLSFGEDARGKIFKGITKLTDAVSSTLGASGKCVMFENSEGKPVITKDGGNSSKFNNIIGSNRKYGRYAFKRSS